MLFHRNNIDIITFFNQANQQPNTLAGQRGGQIQLEYLNNYNHNNNASNLLQTSDAQDYNIFRRRVEQYIQNNRNLLNTHAFTAEEVQILNRVMETTEVKIDGQDDACPICMEDLGSGEALVHHPVCHHKFHTECLGAWLMRNPTCPVCRRGSRSSLLEEMVDYLNYRRNSQRGSRDEVRLNGNAVEVGGGAVTHF